MNTDDREKVINTALLHMAAKGNPTYVEINERIKRKYWI
jgi:hypothetical protein